MLKTKQDVLTWFENTGFNYWTLYHRGKIETGNYADKSGQDENATQMQAIEELALAIARRVGHYDILASPRPGVAAKGTCRESFNLTGLDGLHGVGEYASQITPATIAAAPVAMDEESINKRIAAAVKAALDQKELSELRQKVKDLETENAELSENTPLAKLAGLAETYAPALIPALIGQQPAPMAKVAGIVEGVEAVNDEYVSEEIQSRFEAIINRFERIDPEGWLDKLEKLSLKVEANPALMNMLNML